MDTVAPPTLMAETSCTSHRVVAAIVALVECTAGSEAATGGLYHFSNAGVISWWDFFCVGAMNAEFEGVFGTICPGPLTLQMTPASNTIALNTEGDPTTGTTATGFTLFLNGMRHFFVGSPPPAGTVWTLRTYSGTVTASTGVDTDDPGGYEYYSIYDQGRGASGLRPGLIPGLSFKWVSTSSSHAETPSDMSTSSTLDSAASPTSAAASSLVSAPSSSSPLVPMNTFGSKPGVERSIVSEPTWRVSSGKAALGSPSGRITQQYGRLLLNRRPRHCGEMRRAVFRR